MTSASPSEPKEPAGIMARTAERSLVSGLASTPARSGWQRVREGLPLVMSVLAFVLSLSSLYLSVLRAGNVSAMTGPVLALSHDPLTGAARVSLAVNLANTGARLITVAGLQLRITAPDQKTVYTLTALTQQTLDDKGEPRDSGLLAPVTLPARSESTHQLGFVATDAEVALLKPGRYQFALLLKTAAGEPLQLAEQWLLELSEPEINQLQHWYQLNIGNSVMLAKP